MTISFQRTLLHQVQTSVLCHVAWQRLSTADVPLLRGSRPRGMAIISRQSHTLTFVFMLVLSSAANSRAGLTCNCQPPVGLSVKFLLAFVSTVIPGFTLLEIHDQDF
jgi:hypothetical protein